MGSIQQFLHAVEVFQAPHSSSADRKGAEAWISSFQRSDEGWSTSLQVLAAANQPLEVETFAAQALKTKARLCRSQQDVCQHLQNDLVQLLHKRSDLALTPLKQVVLALVNVTFPLLAGLPQLIQNIAQALPLKTCLLVLEMLADEVSTLQPFGPGSIEERANLVMHVKTGLRSHANDVFAWLAQVAASQPTRTPSSAPATEVVASLDTQAVSEQEQASARAASAILTAFSAWTKLGCLQDIGMGESQALVSLALAHAQDLSSLAFSSSAEVLSEVLDYCPNSWLDALQVPMLRLADLAMAAAKGGKPGHAETICRVVAPYATLRVDMSAPGSNAGSVATVDALLGLGLLPHVAAGGSEGDDPVAWPALQAWTALAETWMEEEVGGYDLFDDAEFYADGSTTAGGGGSSHADGSASEQQQQPQQQHEEENGSGGSRKRSAQGAPADDGAGNAGRGSGDGPVIMTAAQLVQAQSEAAAAVPEEVRSLYERLFVGLLHNMVLWQQQTNGGESVMDGFTPSFTAALGDCLAAICGILGARRFTALLYMMVADGNADEATAPKVAAAAMHAISAAGGTRLTSDPEALQAVAAVMQRTAGSELRSHSTLVGFCCALAATGRATLKCLAATPSTAHAAPGFLSSAFTKAMAGVLYEDDSMDVQTPAALAVKALMSGAQEAGLSVPLSCLQSLVDALQKLRTHDAAAEQALVVALSSAVCMVAGGPDVQRQAEQEALRQLAAPLHGALVSVNTTLGQGSKWAGKLRESADEQLNDWLRRYALLLQHALNTAGGSERQAAATLQQRAASGGQGGAGTGAGNQSEVGSGFEWLARMFLQQLWPLLASLLMQHEACGAFVQPLCRTLCIMLRVQPVGMRDAVPGVLEALVGALFRVGGKHASEPLVVALEALGAHGSMAELLQHAASAVLSAARVTELCELRRADTDPDLAEGVLKVATGYVRHTLAGAAVSSPDVAASSLGSICKLAAACCTANHRNVATLALQCASSVIGAARGAASAGALPHVPQAVLQHACLLTAGLQGGLLCASPLGRVQKIGSVLTELTGLGLAALGARLLDPAQVLASAQEQGFAWSADDEQHHAASGQQQQAAVHAAGGQLYDPRAATALVWGWLLFAAQQFTLEQAERNSILAAWPSALLEAVGAEKAAAREQQLAGRRLKKLLRDFAELHSRTA